MTVADKDDDCSNEAGESDNIVQKGANEVLNLEYSRNELRVMDLGSMGSNSSRRSKISIKGHVS